MNFEKSSSSRMKDIKILQVPQKNTQLLLTVKVFQSVKLSKIVN